MIAMKLTRASGQKLPMEADWVGARPCPICGLTDTCLVHAEEPFASCASRPSDWPLTNGEWLHRFVP